VEHFLQERNRLLAASARVAGLACLAIALICMALPGVLMTPVLIATLPLFATTAVCLVRAGVHGSLRWIIPGIVAGLAILAVVQFSERPEVRFSLGTSLVPLAGGALAAFGIMLIGSRRRLVLLAATFIASCTLTEFAGPWSGVPSRYTVGVVLGWILAITFAYGFGASVPRAADRIVSIGRAHRAERQASEMEAQRRQSARLLHDTVLATLTLLAHSGVGVSPDALRLQARDDARLLRQLRMGSVPVPTTGPLAAVQAQPPPTSQEIVLGHTLESVKARFGRMGLDVSWHGSGQVLLPTEVLDAFLLALAECLENVRRHSGVTDAHVTITEDDDTVRAMVTDAGVGFALEEIDSARLGFKESVVGRLKEVGGNARLFSSPGAGTTVVLEVPR